MMPIAEAILDRLLERGTHYVLRGRSYRTRHHKEEPPPLSEDAA
jgi:DNA replication protein DnaC